MSTRVISSPGIQVNEIDQSLIVRSPAGTNIFMTGFAPQGPTDEVLNVGSVSEFESIFGIPTNEAERYFYHSARQVLTQSPGNLLVTRMPYGSGSGAGFANMYSALVFPVKALSAYKVNNFEYALSAGYVNGEPATVMAPTKAVSSITTTILDNLSGNYGLANYLEVQAPKSILLTDDQYNLVISNDISWNSTSWTASAYNAQTGEYYNTSTKEIRGFDDLSMGGIVVINPTKVAVDSLYQGYYITLADNFNNNPATDFDCVTGVKAVASQTIQGTNVASQGFVDVSPARLNFKLNQKFNETGTSLSQIVEQYPTGYDFGTESYNDCLTLMSFKIRSSLYAQDTVTLDYATQEGYTGSLYVSRNQNNPSGGYPISFNLEKIANSRSSGLRMVVNPFISTNGDWMGPDGLPLKTVRVSKEARNLYSQGVFVRDTDLNSNDVGNVPAKLQRVLQRVEDLDTDLDVVCEAGLGTIWCGAAAKAKSTQQGVATQGLYVFDETYPVSDALLKDLKIVPSDSNLLVESSLKENYEQIGQQFFTFAERTRRDHVFILDPLRYIFVNGPNTKAAKKEQYNFSTDVYWALKNQFGGIVSSYGATYGNWLKYFDSTSGSAVWLPPSGYVAADIAFSTSVGFPWSAPAGFNRGVLTNVTDLAINPTQKQRDLLYKININPISYFAGDGYVIFGQKTLFTKPSAFDRINVRRLFLTLEKATKRLLKYFVFEPNTYSTRTRLVNALSPIFNSAKNNDGLYDYKIICDERNNTPDVIDNNELKIAIYIQPVRTAEFVLADFVATRTGVNFNEITS